MSALRIEALERRHDCEGFHSGEAALDEWLRRYALIAAAAGTARSYVLVDGDQVRGYYALAAGSVGRGELPRRQARGTPRHPIGVILLARLAVDTRLHGRGYGRLLVADASLRAIAAADVIGARALLAHASDESAAGFYRRLGFTASETDPLHQFVLVSDLRRSLVQ